MMALRKDLRRAVMTRVFFDIDGVLAEFREGSSMEEMLGEGYFLDLAPQSEVIEALERLAAAPGFEVHTLSSVLSESRYALNEKKLWLCRHVRSVREGRVSCEFLPCGVSKRSAVPGGVRPGDILIDDYNVNLRDWQKSAIAVKLLNGINHRHGSWKGLTAGRDASEIVRVVMGAAGQ